MAIAAKTADKNRYRAEPTVLAALRSPRILTREVLAGLVVAMALIPEAISFSIISVLAGAVTTYWLGMLAGGPLVITVGWMGAPLMPPWPGVCRSEATSALMGTVMVDMASTRRVPRCTSRILNRTLREETT